MIAAVVVAELNLAGIAAQGLLLALAVHDRPVRHQLPIAATAVVCTAVLACPALLAHAPARCACAMIGALVEDLVIVGLVDEGEGVGTYRLRAGCTTIPFLAVNLSIKTHLHVCIGSIWAASVKHPGIQ